MIGAGASEGLRFVSDYISLIAEVDISKVSEKRRDPYKVTRLLQSIARNISTEVTLTALAKDTSGSDGRLDDETVADYLSALERLMTIENLPAWNTHIRSLEIDAIIEYADGTWGAFEIKLGIGAADQAAANLIKFADKIDSQKVKAPASLTVMTGNGFAHRRQDGVNVVPLSTLTI
ncbi:MAG: hypothetical protein EOM08_07885 [Clostridia bacterium]|nr:hypothetical protein [Clostridia bacterium]NCC76336.1 hypothetical protein [Clostridia bacterium]